LSFNRFSAGFYREQGKIKRIFLMEKKEKGKERGKKGGEGGKEGRLPSLICASV